MSFSTSHLVDLTHAVRIGRDGSAKLLRNQAGVSAAAVGSACGVTASTISRWENGRRRPTGPQAVAWVRLLRRLERAEANRWTPSAGVKPFRVVAVTLPLADAMSNASGRGNRVC